MSEFKFACPVCGQHMKCDASHGGAVMQCPTCFQNITAPQAPAADSKFILTGTQASDKKNSTRGYEAATGPVAENKFPAAIFIGVLVLVLAAGAAAFIFHGKIFKSENTAAPKTVAVITNSAPPPKPAPVAPHASDTNWMMVLDDAVTPNMTAAGRIHGQDFVIERAYFQNGTLTLRAGARGAIESGVQINFSGALAESLAGQTINVNTNADKAAPVTLRWKDASGTRKENYDVGYALRLEFGALEKNHLPGKIYLCLPDAEKSYLMGTFNADAHKPKPKPPKK
ncbi:MAG TPA: hypothetical protein VIK62_01945 [Verrucomicrobiae bacterium]